MHVLIIEPDMHLAQAYSRAMEQRGHTTASAFTAQEALHQADHALPDVVALELQLPGPNGIAFLQEFRSYPDWRNVPVVLHTYASPYAQSDVRATLENQFGVVSWLYKPQTTLQQLQTILESHGQSRT
jgi:CheY-like chemotaxis protein